MNKKTYIIIAVVLGVVLVVAIILLFALRGGSSETSQTTEGENTDAGRLEPAKEGSGGGAGDDPFPQLSLPEISRLSEHKTAGITLSDSGEDILFFSLDQGDFFSVGINGDGLEKLSEKSFYGVSKVAWAPTGDRAALFFERTDTGEQRGVYIYDLFSKSIEKLPTNFQRVTFSPDGEKIAYWYSDIESKTFNLSMANCDGTGFDVLTNKYLENGIINWNSVTGNIYIADDPAEGLITSAYSVNQTTGDLRTIISRATSMVPQFSTSGNMVFYTFNTGGNSKNISSAIVNTSGGQAQFNYFKTVADKAVWNKDENLLYVAIPSVISSGFSLTDYWAGRTTTRDNLYVYDLNTGEKTLLLNPADYGEVVDIRNPILSDDEKLMFFVSAIDNNIYAINLEKIESAVGFEAGTSISDSTGGESFSGSSTSGGSGSGESDSSRGLTPEQRLFRQL